MKRIVFTITFSLFAIVLMAQVPAGFNYQAVVRNTSGEIVANKTVKFRISILQNSGIGTAVYVETHSVPTGNFGLANFVVGLGNRVSGSLDPEGWGNNPHFLKIELDPDNGNSFSHLGTMQLMAVPYAFHAQTVEIDNVDDADSDATNELQDLSIDGHHLQLSKSSGIVDLSSYLDNTDSQELSISENSLTISGGNTVTLPLSDGGDDWGADFVHTNATLDGQGTTASPLKIAQQSATAGQVLKWNGSTWAPADDVEGSEESNPTGPAGGDLSGTYPNPTIGDGKVTSAKIMDGTIATADIANNAVTEAKIASGAITGAKIAQIGATSGQALKWNGTTWAPANDESGGLTLPYQGGATTSNSVFTILNHSTSGYAAILGETIGTTTALVGSASQGTGVLGYSYAGTGVHGYVETGTSPTAIYGQNKSILGAPVAVKGNVITESGFSGHFTGGKFYVGGKVGLGTTTPSQQLSIGNNLDLYSGSVNSPQKPSIRGGEDHLFINSNGSSGVLVFNYDAGSGETWFNKGTRNLLMITKEGRIGMGNTSPQARLHVTGTGFPDSFIYIQSNNGQDAGIRLYEGNNVKWHIFNDPAVAGLQIYNTTGNNAIFAKQSNAYVGLGTTNPTQKLHVVGDAYKTVGGNTWASSSDLRLKTVLGDYEKGLTEITALQPVRFRYLENNPRQLPSDSEQVGFVAQDVQKIFPEAVSEAEDGYLDFNIHAVNVALINAIKELKAENDKLKSEMVQMKTEYETRLSKVEYLISANAEK